MSVKHVQRGRSVYSIEEKIEAVRQRMYQELSYQEILDLYGISNSTLGVWLKNYKSEVLRRCNPNDIPLYVRKYQEKMTSAEMDELSRLRQENADLKLLNEASLLMIEMAKERFGIDVKKNYEETLSGTGCLTLVE